MSLEDFYKGDDNWKCYYYLHACQSLSGDKYIGNEFIFKNIIGSPSKEKSEIMTVIISLMGLKDGFTWLNTKEPDIGNLTPAECLQKINSSDSRYLKRLRVFLTRAYV